MPDEQTTPVLAFWQRVPAQDQQLLKIELEWNFVIPPLK
jgi:hypothetical protein